MAAAASASASTRANTLSRIFASSSPTPPPKPSPKIKRAPTQKPPAVDADSISGKKPPKPLGAQPAAEAPCSDAGHHKPPNSLRAIFKGLLRQRDPDKLAAEAPCSDAGHHKPPNSLRAIFKGLLRQRDPDKLVSEFVEASAASSRFRDKHHVYKAAVSRLASSGRQDGIQAILDAQKRFLEASTEAFAARLIRLYGRASMPSHAVAAFHELPAKHKSTGTFNAVLAACDEGGDFDAVVAAFQEIPASHPSVAPNAYSYNVLIRALCKKPDLAAALEAVSLMEKHGVSPDIISFSTLLNGFYKRGLMDDAETVWDMMKERNLEPDAKCYNAKLRGLVAAGRIEDAAAVVERLEKDGPKPDTVSYNELIRGYCKAGRLQDAKKLFDDLIKNGCAPNKGTYGTLLPLLLQAQELDCALRYCHDLLSSKRTNGLECDLLQDVVNALIEASRVEEATKLVELGQNGYYLRKGLRMPHTAQDNEVIAETDEEESISEEKVL